jgi:hypothetical protein
MPVCFKEEECFIVEQCAKSFIIITLINTLRRNVHSINEGRGTVTDTCIEIGLTKEKHKPQYLCPWT